MENSSLLEIGDVSFQARIPALDSGQYDFTTSMNVTPEREEAVLFSDPVSEGGIVTAVRSVDLQGQGVSVSDFNGKRAGITTGSIHDSIIHKVLPDSPISEYSNYTDMTTALKTGMIDYFLASTDTASHIIEAEFSEKDRTLSMNFTWGGEAYNPVADGDAHNTGADEDGLSSAIVNRISKEIRYERDEKNHLLVVL